MIENDGDLLLLALRAFEARDRDRAAAFLACFDAQASATQDRRWGAAARLAASLGEANLSVSAIRKHVAQAPYDVDRRLAYGALLASTGRVQRAVEATQAFLAHTRPDARLHHLIGTSWSQLGETELALQSLRQALDLDPSLSQAATTWLTLVDLKTFTPGDPDIAAMQTLIRKVGSDHQQTAPLHYALGKALHDSGDPQAAFIAYQAGAALVQRVRPFAAEASSAFVDGVVNHLDAERFATLSPSLVDSERPMFVLGIPRSGTTLVEQILTSHSTVSDGAEISLFSTAAMALEGFGPDALTRFASRPDTTKAWTEFGQAYLHLLDERFGADGRVVDKTLSHSRFLGHIKHVLPKARFIWLRRNPADTALSCFRTHFADGLNWSWSLADIGRHFRDEDRLHRHWTAQYPDDILTVHYEDLVSDPSTWIGRIANHYGLSVEPGMSEFHSSRRAVATASVSQVRQPVHQRAIGGWRAYEAPMKAFFEAYEA